MTAEFVDAAGGIVVDDRGRVAVVHRPHRDDWSLPKGHVEDGERRKQAALREVLEETGLVCAIVRRAGDVSYIDRRGRPKRVRYFLMRVERGAFAPNDEVDELRWVGRDELDVLTYADDVELVRRSLDESAKRQRGR